ncbi:MAG: DUF2484 family protein [Paracoccaceae bacterium]
MSYALIAACLWALCATVTALLPMRLQYPPGVTLLLLAPGLLIWLGFSHGPLPAAAAGVGFLSMFRRPLWYLGRKALGLPVPPRPGAGKSGQGE